LDNGQPAQCNPGGDRPCCGENGWCGSTDIHCKCNTCVDYTKIEYKLVKSGKGKSWIKAEQHCIELGGHLARVYSQETNTQLIRQMKENGIERAWIGYNDGKAEGLWEWTHGNRNIYNKQMFLYEPNGGDEENCAQLQTGSDLNGEWNVIPCYRRRHFICQIYKKSVNATIVKDTSKWSELDKKQCAQHPSETYTFDVPNGCDGWKNTDFETCKEYCRRNALPKGCKIHGEAPTCEYIIYTTTSSVNTTAGWCHNAKACTLEDFSKRLVAKFERDDECFDKAGILCTLWKPLGWCENPAFSFMREHCARTCNVCGKRIYVPRVHDSFLSTCN